jgi:hypothetical protein
MLDMCAGIGLLALAVVGGGFLYGIYVGIRQWADSQRPH